MAIRVGDQGRGGELGRLARKVGHRAVRLRADLPLILLDILTTAGAYSLVMLLRFDGDVPAAKWNRFGVFLIVAMIVHVAANWMGGLYRQMWRHASVAEAQRVMGAGLIALATLLVLDSAASLRTPLAVVLLGSMVTTAVVGGLRFQSRLFSFRRSSYSGSGLRVAVLGAGAAGATVIREMRRNSSGGLVPVAAFDDDPRYHGRMLAGIPILGTIDQLPMASVELGCNQAVLAIPSANAELVRRVAAVAERAGLTLKVLPHVSELVGGQVSIRDVRDIRIEDLLGRQQIETDLEGVRHSLTGRTVLITGAGGSIGSEIARQVADCKPRQLILLDNDETHLHDAAATISTDSVQVLCDVRNRERLIQLFRRYRPGVVFHAAALKHVPLLESHATEAISTNVMGTANVAAAAAAVGVHDLVFISTDKAVRPSSVMGASKWVGEQIVLATAPVASNWCAVRFGNVLGSRGSVISTFTRQIAHGGPVTVTDAGMTRFFMSIHEAVQLVIQASAFHGAGDVFMLEMGEPVKIYELAEKMIRLTGRRPGTDIAIKVTGTRAGEKLEEELQGPGEQAQPTAHPSIVRLIPTIMDTDKLDRLLRELDTAVDRRDDSNGATLLLGAAGRAEQGSIEIDLVSLEAEELEGQFDESVSTQNQSYGAST